jgi:hypothetical protein
MVVLYPTVIQPLFNKLSPLREGELRTRTESLASSLKFPLKHLYEIDGSKRSSHSNAYFFGLPWVRVPCPLHSSFSLLSASSLPSLIPSYLSTPSSPVSPVLEVICVHRYLFFLFFSAPSFISIFFPVCCRRSPFAYTLLYIQAKHIVIFDTLIGSSSPPEVEAVLAHELGHWYFAHPSKMLLASQAHILGVLAAFPAFLRAPPVLASFGFPKEIAARPPTIVAFLLFQVRAAFFHRLSFSVLLYGTRRLTPT